jgi:O-methyltransferase
MTFGVSMGGPGSADRWARQRRFFRRGTGTIYRKLQSIKFLLTRDFVAVASFLAARYEFDFPLDRRIDLLTRFIHTTNEIRGYHTLAEILTVSDRIFRRPNAPVVVEAGSGSGSSTAKLSLAAQIVGGKLHVFDSFQGIPENDEKHRMLDGRELMFRRGAFKGRLTSVKQRVEKFGAIEVCTFHKGLFEHTLPSFTETVNVALLDVDLISSTRTCVKHFFPQLAPDGVLLSQDGHLLATVELFSSADFWRKEVGVAPPHIIGLGTNKMLELKR